MTQAAQPQLSDDFDTELEQVKRSRAQIDALRKQFAMQGIPKGEMIGKRWTPPTMQEYLQPAIQQYAAYAGEKQANEKEAVLQKAMQAQASQWMGAKPQTTQVEQAGPVQEGEGPLMSAPIKPTQQQNLEWAQQGQKNPLTRALAQQYTQDQLIQEPAREEARQQAKDLLSQRQAEHQQTLAEQQVLARDKLAQEAKIAKQASEDRRYGIDAQIAAERRYQALMAKLNKTHTETQSQYKERSKLETGLGNIHDRHGALIEAEDLVPKSTGSLPGSVVDKVVSWTGLSTGGADAIGGLKALEGRLIAGGPKYGGPSSNQDVKDYKAAVGTLADPQMPRDTRMTALQTVKRIAKEDMIKQTRHAQEYNKRAREAGLPEIDIPELPEFAPDVQPGTPNTPAVPKTPTPSALPRSNQRVASGKIGGLEPPPGAMPLPGAMPPGIPPGANIPTNVSQGPPVTAQVAPNDVDRAGILMSEYRKPLQPVPGEDPALQAARHATDKESLRKELERMGIDAETGGPLQRRAADKVAKPTSNIKTWNPATRRLE